MNYPIEDYYAVVDSGKLGDAVDLLAEDVEFVMVLPSGVRTGRGRAAMLEYLGGRPDVDRKHRVLRVAADGDMQFAHGAVIENGTVTTGYFVAAMHFDAAGRIDRYQVTFNAEFPVLPGGFTPEGAQRA
ncbi:nuclear transport factor 2 family protein [Nocardia sp. BSTN01]|uniref:nuclear transport factor 2 family protein n=1 Tax=Nocardia sp. BSTN01 TaxID=2783665 RepID=UPI0018907979|nr:nuclear transport factor 2 family protein [Nocardia sp. BSTN01]MBF4996927.1 nuclear transport factor 2 family protein [Nocardia sp. BSTN01]